MGKHYDLDRDGRADRDDEVSRFAARTGTSAAAVIANYGIQNVPALIAAATAEGMEIAAAATVLEKESWGRNVWGHDPVSTGGVYVKGGAVTEADYLAYRRLAQTGSIGRQGVGPCQLTSSGFQNLGDSLGGSWDPTANMRAGFRGLQTLIREYGVQDGARRYNGSGPAAEAYGRDFLAKYNAWRARLAGTVVTPIPVKRKVLPDMPERAIPAGNTGHRIVCPTGSASAVVARAWLSASFDGSAVVEVWAQKSGAAGPVGSANDAAAHRVWNVRPGDRPWLELPSGTEFVTVHVTNATGPGSIAVEQLPA